MDCDWCISGEHCLDLPWWSLRIMMFCPNWIQQIGCSGANTRQHKDAIMALQSKTVWWEQIETEMEKAGGGLERSKGPSHCSHLPLLPLLWFLKLWMWSLEPHQRVLTLGSEFQMRFEPLVCLCMTVWGSPSFSVNGRVKNCLRQSEWNVAVLWEP